jgi:hypothetical protein
MAIFPLSLERLTVLAFLRESTVGQFLKGLTVWGFPRELAVSEFLSGPTVWEVPAAGPNDRCRGAAAPAEEAGASLQRERGARL